MTSDEKLKELDGKMKIKKILHIYNTGLIRIGARTVIEGKNYIITGIDGNSVECTKMSFFSNLWLKLRTLKMETENGINKKKRKKKKTSSTTKPETSIRCR